MSASVSYLPDERRAAPRLLERVAFALSSTLELKEVLRLLAEVSLDAAGADRTAVFLLEGRQLWPATCVGVHDDHESRCRFRAMPPTTLNDSQWTLLENGAAVVVPDAKTSHVLPTSWMEVLDPRHIALIPLLAAGEPCGLMTVERDGIDLGSDQLRTLEAIGAYAGIAIRNARWFTTVRRRARLQQAVADSAAHLACPMSCERIARRLVSAYFDLLGTRLCAVAFLDPDREQITSITSRGTRDLRGPIPVSDVPAHIVDRLWTDWAAAKRPVLVEDDRWLAEFVGGPRVGASSYVFLPLVIDGHARGVVVLGFGEHTRLDADEQSAAEALADIAAAAFERQELLARLDTQVHRLDALYKVSGQLNRSTSPTATLEVIACRFEELLETVHCSVNLAVDGVPPAFRMLTGRGEPWFTSDPKVLDRVLANEVARVQSTWRRRVRPVSYSELSGSALTENFTEAVRSAVMFPLMNGKELLGVIVAGFAAPTCPTERDLETGQAMADLAAAAISRARVDEALRLRLHQVEAMYRLSDVIAGAADLTAAVQELNHLFRPELRISLGPVAVANRERRAAVGVHDPDPEEMTAIRSWRAVLARTPGPLEPRSCPGGWLVPVVHQNRVHGVLRVRVEDVSLDATETELLVAIGAGCGEVIYKAGLHRDLADRERRLAIAAERERIGQDLHDSVGQILTGMGLRLSQYLAECPDDTWRERIEDLVALAAQGSREVRQSIHALLFLESRHNGLVASLRELAQKFETTTGISVQVEQQGDPLPVPLGVEEALFRMVHEAFANVDRHAQASAVRVGLRFAEGDLTLVVEDDGVGLAARSALAATGDDHFGLTGIRQRLRDVGGELHVGDGESRGVVVTGRVRLAVDEIGR